MGMDREHRIAFALLLSIGSSVDPETARFVLSSDPKLATRPLLMTDLDGDGEPEVLFDHGVVRWKDGVLSEETSWSIQTERCQC